MGLWDSLFGKKATLELSDENGRPIKRVVTEKQLKDWEAKGMVSVLPLVQVHVLDPKGSYTTKWQVGKDISEEIASKAKDSVTGDLYAMTYYEAGEPKTVVLLKSRWLEAKAAMGE